MDWEVGVSEVKGLKSGLGKHGACSGDGGEGGCIWIVTWILRL